MSDRIAVFNARPDRAGRGARRGLRATRDRRSSPASSARPTSSTARRPPADRRARRHVHRPAREDPPRGRRGRRRRDDVTPRSATTDGRVRDRRLPRPGHPLPRGARRGRRARGHPAEPATTSSMEVLAPTGAARPAVWKRQHIVAGGELGAGPEEETGHAQTDPGLTAGPAIVSDGVDAATSTAATDQPRRREPALALGERCRPARARPEPGRREPIRASTARSPLQPTIDLSHGRRRGRGRAQHHHLGRLRRGRRRTSPSTTGSTPFEEATGCKVNIKIGDTSDEMVTLMRSRRLRRRLARPATRRCGSSPTATSPRSTSAAIPGFGDVAPFLQNAPHYVVDGKHYGVPARLGRQHAACTTPRWSRPPRPAGTWCSTRPRRSRTAGKITAYDAPIYIADAALYLKAHQPELGITDPYELTQQQFDAAVELLKAAAAVRRQVLVPVRRRDRQLHQRRPRPWARPGRTRSTPCSRPAACRSRPGRARARA